MLNITDAQIERQMGERAALIRKLTREAIEAVNPASIFETGEVAAELVMLARRHEIELQVGHAIIYTRTALRIHFAGVSHG